MSSLQELVEAGNTRILVVGAVGSGKSTIVREFASGDPDLVCVSADPGNPAFGPPAAVSAARWREGWELVGTEPLGTLDAVRYRSVLALAVRRLLKRLPEGRVVIDAPGVSRGVGASELLAALVELCDVGGLLLIGPPHDALDLIEPAIVHFAPKPASARPGGDAARRSRRTRAWNGFHDAPIEVPIAAIEVVDHQVESGLQGRVGVVVGESGAIGLGWIDRGHLRWTPTTQGTPRRVVLRDARFDADALQTIARKRGQPEEQADAMIFTMSGKPSIRVGLPMQRVASARLSPVGDWFDDPMWLLRLDHRRRCIAFDLGEVHQLPTRVVHELSDVFVSHAHLDHVRDFLWLIRKRLGTTTPCRLIGPVGFAKRVQHMIESCTWDRVEARGPRFDVGEFDGSSLRWFELQVGASAKLGAGRLEDAPGGVVLQDDRFVVRSVVLDHHLPVLAFALEECARFDVRPEALRERGWQAGKWLGTLKSLASRGETSSAVEVPGVGGFSVSELAEALLLRRRSEKFAYATDLADHAANRAALIELAYQADVFVCEAAFREHDRAQAERTGHLTARACGEIAMAADVRWLVPFHPSSRYHEDWRELLDEVRSACDRVTGGFRERGA